MKKNNKKEEFLSRREFFKNAVRFVLPILGTIVLSSNPVLAKSKEMPTGCKSGCYSTCSGGCDGECKYTCTGTCKNSCTGCQYTCDNTCKNSCRMSNSR